MQQLFLHLFELQSKFFLLELLLLFLLISQLFFPLKFLLLLHLISKQLILLLLNLLFLLLQARRNIFRLFLYLLLNDNSISLHGYFALEHLLQSLDFSLILSNHSIFWVFIDLWLVLDFLGL